MIGHRTRLSLGQYLARQGRPVLDVLFDKHGLLEAWAQWRDFEATRLEALVHLLGEAPPDRLLGVIQEVVATEPDLQENVVNQWGDGAAAYRARWDDLQRCLLLDGYGVVQRRLTTVEPDLEGAHHAEDALAAEIRRSELPSADGIVSLLDQSADAFRQVAPNYNACLSNARTALQTTAVEMALARQKRAGGSFQPDKLGQVLSYLRTSGLITRADEDLVSSVYTFISPGAHQPIGLSKEEMVRLGRGMAISTCYFLIKIHNG